MWRFRYLSLFAYNSFFSTRLSWSLLGVVLLLSACESEGLTHEDIQGQWSVISATRNGKETTTLEYGYFDFSNDTVFLTNIYSSDQSFGYELRDNKIYQEGGENAVYTVQQNDVDSLVLSTTIRDFDFRFVAVRDTLNPVQEELE